MAWCSTPLPGPISITCRRPWPTPLCTQAAMAPANCGLKVALVEKSPRAPTVRIRLV